MRKLELSRALVPRADSNLLNELMHSMIMALLQLKSAKRYGKRLELVQIMYFVGVVKSGGYTAKNDLLYEMRKCVFY